VASFTELKAKEADAGMELKSLTVLPQFLADIIMSSASSDLGSLAVNFFTAMSQRDADLDDVETDEALEDC
jgi:hypothetical protein